MLRFDHAVIAVRDLDAADATLTDFGFIVERGGRHIGFGTENAIVRFGLDYLELMTVCDEAEAQAASARSRALAEFLRRFPSGLVGYALATSEPLAIGERLAGAGQACEGPTPMRRRRPDGVELEWELLIPGGVAWRRPWPFFINWAQPDPWRLAVEQPRCHANGACCVSGVSVAVEDLARTKLLYDAMLGEAVETGTRLVYRIADFEICVADTSAARIDPQRGPGPFELRLRVGDINQTRDVLGARASSTSVGITVEPLPAVRLVLHA